MEATEVPTDLLGRQRRFAQLANRKAQLEAELATTKLGMAQLEESIIDGMIEIEQPSTRIEGRTIFIHRQLWARAKGEAKEEAAKALRDEGLEEYVTEGFNTNSVSALFREWDRADEDGTLTDEDRARRDRLLASFQVDEAFSLRANK